MALAGPAGCRGKVDPADGLCAVLKERHQLFIRLLGLTDGAVAASAAFGAWWLRNWAYGITPQTGDGAVVRDTLVLFVVPATLYALSAMGLYRPRRDRRVVGEIGQIFKACFVALALLVLALWTLNNSFLQASVPAGGRDELWGLTLPSDDRRFQLVALAVLLPLSLGLERWVFRMVLRHVRRRGWNRRWACIVGTGRLAQITAETLLRNSWTGVEVAYFVSHHDESERGVCRGRQVHGGLSGLMRTLAERPVDMVYLALPSRKASELPRILSELERCSCDVRIVPDVPLRYLPVRLTLTEFDGMPILNYRQAPVYGMGAFWKRALDVLGGSLALCLFAPVMVIAAVLVAMSGPGPVIFRQRRVSLGGDEFEIFKFRTMSQVRDENPLAEGGVGRGTEAWTAPNDRRVTRIGAWLRRTSIDELPQLFNVLRGEMSLVGPRPERPELIERFREDWRGYMLRQQVKAGMTGWAQIHGLRGNTSLRKRLQYDLFYIRHWSIWLDLRILIMTAWRGFVHKNAY